MSKYTFQCEYNNVETTKTIEADTLPEILEEFGFFLKGCGFHLKGEIEVVENE